MSLPKPVACQLRDAILDQVRAELDGLIGSLDEHPFGEVWYGSRYLPQTDRMRLNNLHVSVYWAMEKPMAFESGQEGDEDLHTIDIALCQAIPPPALSNGMPELETLDNTDFGDQILHLAEVVKNLWRPADANGDSGRLRNTQLAGCDFQSLEHDPPIHPAPLINSGVMAVVLSVTYRQGF